MSDSAILLDSFLCPYCALRNYRQHAGQDKCEECGALVLTTDQVYEGEPFRVLLSITPSSDLLSSILV